MYCLPYGVVRGIDDHRSLVSKSDKPFVGAPIGMSVFGSRGCCCWFDGTLLYVSPQAKAQRTGREYRNSSHSHGNSIVIPRTRTVTSRHETPIRHPTKIDFSTIALLVKQSFGCV